MKNSPTDLSKFRQILETLSSRVRADAMGMVDQVLAGSAGGNSNLSNAPFHLGEMGTDEFMYDMNATLLENEQYIIAEAREALVRIDQGTYGNCESCGQPIVPARLEAIPFTRYCMKCAEVNDQTPQVSLDDGRPHSPKDTLSPEGEMDEDRVTGVNPLEFPAPRIHHGDIHAAGTAGGGTAVGGLAGGNQGSGDPVVAELDEATASGNFDIQDDRVDDRTPLSGRAGGAIGGTPARKRAK